MVRETTTAKSRIAWLAMHGGFLAWGICLLVLAEDHRDGGDDPAGNAEKRPPLEFEPGEPIGKKSAAWLNAQIDHLGNPNYGVRAKATRQLLAAGPEAVDQLAAALLSGDPEVVRRSQYILSQLVRRDAACLHALEQLTRLPQHPAARLARPILEREAIRREQSRIALGQERKQETQRLLREARTDLDQRDFIEARRKTAAAKALGANVGEFDDRPDLVQAAIEQAEMLPDVSPVAAEANSPE